MNPEDFLQIPPYSLERDEKRSFLLARLQELTERHAAASPEYRAILSAYGMLGKRFRSLEEFPFLPVRLFKEYELKSCPDEAVVKTLTSSGTTSQRLSRIFLDKETATLQTRALVRIMQQVLGKKRLPMLIIDSRQVIRDRKMFSARGAGILGLANFGRDHTYALDERMRPDLETILRFADRHRNEPIFIFGFTFMIWQYFYRELEREGVSLDLDNGILIHSGGWKKLADQAVDAATFKSSITDRTGIRRIHDFYGMVEQVGSIFVECESGHLHAPVFADLLIRDPMSLETLPFGEEGLIEVFSVLPRSYPGHILLTEDLGTVLGEDDCPCGRKGKYFSVRGRLPRAELRGCSDTHAQNMKEAR